MSLCLVSYRSIIEHVAGVLEREGSDSWWSKGEDELLPPTTVEELKNNGKPLPKKVSLMISLLTKQCCSKI